MREIYNANQVCLYGPGQSFSSQGAELRGPYTGDSRNLNELKGRLEEPHARPAGRDYAMRECHPMPPKARTQRPGGSE